MKSGKTYAVIILLFVAITNIVFAKPDSRLLFSAIRKGDTITVTRLIQEGVDVNAKDDEGRTALMKAVFRKESSKIVKLLIELGADVHVKDNEGRSALMYALYSETTEEETIRLLIQAGADINAKDDGGAPAFIYAAEKNAKFIKLLIELGADVHAKSNNGASVLMLFLSMIGVDAASEQETIEKLRLLIQAGADINAKDDEGHSLLFDMRGWHGISSNMLKFLLQSGMDINLLYEIVAADHDAVSRGLFWSKSMFFYKSYNTYEALQWFFNHSDQEEFLSTFRYEDIYKIETDNYQLHLKMHIKIAHINKNGQTYEISAYDVDEKQPIYLFSRYRPKFLEGDTITCKLLFTDVDKRDINAPIPKFLLISPIFIPKLDE